MAAQALLLAASFLVTGCFNSVITQVIYLYAPINTKSMLLVFCAYIGYSLRGLMRESKGTEAKRVDEERGKARKRDKPKESNEKSQIVYLYMLALVVAEIIAAQLSMIAFAKIGSGLHQVLYSSIIMFTALVSSLVLHKPIERVQWIALLMQTMGLMLSAGRVNTTEVPVEGILFLFTATFIFAVTTSVSEVVIKKYNFESTKYSMYYGFYGSGIIGLYMVFVTSGHWQEWVMGPIDSAGETGKIVVFLLMLILIGGQLVRGMVYYKCLSVLGSVTTGVLYGLQAVCMFSLSAVLFCDATHPNQCFSSSKGIGTLVVSGGVALYSIGAKKEKIKS